MTTRVLLIPISYRRRYLHVADLLLSVVGIYGCVADVTRTCVSYSDGKEVESKAIVTNDIHKATCNICETAVSQGGVRAKAFTTTN